MKIDPILQEYLVVCEKMAVCETADGFHLSDEYEKLNERSVSLLAAMTPVQAVLALHIKTNVMVEVINSLMKEIEELREDQ